MTSAIEKALKAYAVAQLSAADKVFGDEDQATTLSTCQISATDVTLHTRASNDTIGESNIPYVIFACPATKKVAGPVHTGSVHILLATPMRTKGITEDTHRALIARLRALFPDMQTLRYFRANAVGSDAIAAAQAALDAGQAQLTALDAALQANAHCYLAAGNGYFVAETSEAITGNRWGAAIPITLGVEEMPP